MLIRMTGIGPAIVSVFTAGSGGRRQPAWGPARARTDTRTALVIDAALARDGRDLVAPRLRALDAELRLPRSATEARTDVRYLVAQGYRLMVAGPDSRAAVKATGVRAAALRR